MSLNLYHPVPTHKSVSSGFHASRSWGKHAGIDLPCPNGTSLHAVADGVVKYADVMGNAGNIIEIWHADNMYLSRYAHMQKFSVKVGDVVKRGQVIGESNNTGNSTGPHLHFALWFSILAYAKRYYQDPYSTQGMYAIDPLAQFGEEEEDDDMAITEDRLREIFNEELRKVIGINVPRGKTLKNKDNNHGDLVSLLDWYGVLHAGYRVIVDRRESDKQAHSRGKGAIFIVTMGIKIYQKTSYGIKASGIEVPQMLEPLEDLAALPSSNWKRLTYSQFDNIPETVLVGEEL